MRTVHTSAYAAAIFLSCLLGGCSKDAQERQAQRPPAPVEVAEIETASIRALRTFSGALEPRASFVVSPKIGGRLEAMLVDIGDSVERGAVVARIDDAEYQQDCAQAEAELLVAEANLAEAGSALEIATRAMERTRTLSDRGVASDAELDSARSELLAREARVEVQQAQIARANASVATARIRLGYAEVNAQWADDDPSRVVAERFVDEGQTVTANTPLLQIVDIDPLSGVFFVTEKEYAYLKAGQSVEVLTDAYPDQTFAGTIERIAPVFRENSRQARVEIMVPNDGQHLKPGMFIRANVEVRREENATVVPSESIVTRSDMQGIFLVADDGKHARWLPVSVGIREGDRVQLVGEPLEGRVVTLGQQLIEDGSAITLSGATESLENETL